MLALRNEQRNVGDGKWATDCGTGKWVMESGQCERGQNDEGRREVGDAKRGQNAGGDANVDDGKL